MDSVQPGVAKYKSYSCSRRVVTLILVRFLEPQRGLELSPNADLPEIECLPLIPEGDPDVSN